MNEIEDNAIVPNKNKKQGTFRILVTGSTGEHHHHHIHDYDHYYPVLLCSHLYFSSFIIYY